MILTGDDLEYTEPSGFEILGESTAVPTIDTDLYWDIEDIDSNNIDDKTINKCITEEVPLKELTDKYTNHFYDDVKKDFINSMNCLDDGGILICDDFLWFFFEKIEQNPIGAILECYENYRKDLEILFINNQIIFRRLHG